MIFKVCGLTDNASGREISQLEAVSHVGFIFYPLSKRFTSSTFETNKKKVGVFVDASISDLKRQIAIHQLDVVQLHGEESPAYISQIGNSVEIIKAIGIETASDLKKTKAYDGLVTAFLFDTKSDSKGGTGMSFNWSILNQYEGSTSFILSGGLGLQNLAELKQLKHKKLIGYDLNSRFEIAPMEKNLDQIQSFISQFQ